MPSQLSRPPQAALRVTDLWVALKFYSQRLGFKAETAQESKARVTGPVGTPLLLCGPGYTAPGVHHPAPGAWIYLFRPDLAGLSEELSARGLEAGAPVEPYPGFRHLLVEDPDGYVLVFWEPVPLTDEEILAIYRTGPERLQAALAGIDEAGLALRRAPGKWTVRETVHHLVDSDLATFHTLRLALALPGRQIQTDVWEPDEWMAGLESHRRPVGPGVALFAAARAWVLKVLESLPDALDRAVTWPSGYRATVRDLLRQVGGHALHHTMQIEEMRRRHAD